MSFSGSRVTLARWLLEAGAAESARALLGPLRGREANDLREQAASAQLRPGVYALVVHDGVGLVVPVRTRVGSPVSADPDLLLACRTAQQLASAWFGVSFLPQLRIELEELVGVSGASLTLPATLAYIAHFSRSGTLSRAVLASARLADDGTLLPVSHISEKLAAAQRERGDTCVIVPVGSLPAEQAGVHQLQLLAQAVQLAFAGSPLPDATLIAVETQIARARIEPDHQRAIAWLAGLLEPAKAAADRARVHLELGTRLRHAGRSQEATEQHELAQALFVAEQSVLGAETVERYELETWLTAMDQFQLEAAIVHLRARLSEPFSNLRNELRCRGMFAQALAMAGDYGEAVRVRALNLPLHERSDDLARVLPGTLCCLALDAARSGDSAGFESYAARLLSDLGTHDENQEAYDAAAVVRGLVALGRADDALAWAAGSRALFGAFTPPSLRRLLFSEAAITTYPRISVARALCRAYRLLGDAERTFWLAGRVRTASGAGTDLVGWVASLVQFEVAITEHALGKDAHATLLATRERLPRLHAHASNYHSGLLSCQPSDLERELDRVYY